MTTILILSGILAGLVNYFYVYLNLPTTIVPGHSTLAASDEPEKPKWEFPKLTFWLALAGYIIIGCTGAFLTPLLNALIGLKGAPDPNAAQAVWNHWILFGYGIVFGYSTNRLLSSLISNIILKIEKPGTATLEASGQTLLATAKETGLSEIKPVDDLHTPVHLNTKNPSANFKSVPPVGQASPIYEGEGMPFNATDDATKKVEAISKIIGFLKVSDPTHLRYKEAPNGNTFCNIYAYDVCYLMGFLINKFYIPRVWWNENAIHNIINGVPQTPILDKTVEELTANKLHFWFEDYGHLFGWEKISDLTEMQDSINRTGNIGIIVGRKVPHGHITVVVPEMAAEGSGGIKAIRNQDGKVINPLQTQAGVRNFEYGSSTINGKPWFFENHISSFYIYNERTEDV